MKSAWITSPATSYEQHEPTLCYATFCDGCWNKIESSPRSDGSLINGSCSNSCVVGRRVGSRTRHRATNAWHSREKQVSPVSVGGGCLSMRRRTRMGFLPWLGGRPLASSITMMPRFHMSCVDCVGWEMDGGNVGGYTFFIRSIVSISGSSSSGGV